MGEVLWPERRGGVPGEAGAAGEVMNVSDELGGTRYTAHLGEFIANQESCDYGCGAGAARAAVADVD
jgi:hypothetical protein